jgi:hypothetical protein
VFDDLRYWGMAGGMNKRRSGIPMHQRVALGREEPQPTATEPPPAEQAAADDSPGRHCWVLVPADGSGRRRPGLLVEWRRDEDGHWSGRVVYVVRLRTGRWAVLDEWLPQADLSPL